MIPDLHGDHWSAMALLEAAEVPLLPQARVEQGIRVVQLGDCANCVEESVEEDRSILSLALSWFDVVLVGNHEAPYFGLGKFGGFHYDGEVADMIRMLGLQYLLPCYLVGDTLLTHAGVASEWGYKTAQEAFDEITRLWKSSKQGPSSSR